jgi:hypothetical protein
MKNATTRGASPSSGAFLRTPRIRSALGQKWKLDLATRIESRASAAVVESKSTRDHDWRTTATAIEATERTAQRQEKNPDLDRSKNRGSGNRIGSQNRWRANPAGTATKHETSTTTMLTKEKGNHEHMPRKDPEQNNLLQGRGTNTEQQG